MKKMILDEGLSKLSNHLVGSIYLALGLLIAIYILPGSVEDLDRSRFSKELWFLFWGVGLLALIAGMLNLTWPNYEKYFNPRLFIGGIEIAISLETWFLVHEWIVHPEYSASEPVIVGMGLLLVTTEGARRAAHTSTLNPIA